MKVNINQYFKVEYIKGTKKYYNYYISDFDNIKGICLGENPVTTLEKYLIVKNNNNWETERESRTTEPNTTETMDEKDQILFLKGFITNYNIFNIESEINSVEIFITAAKSFYIEEERRHQDNVNSFLKSLESWKPIYKKYFQLLTEYNWCPITTIPDDQVQEFVKEYSEKANTESLQFEIDDLILNAFNESEIIQIRDNIFSNIGNDYKLKEIINEGIAAHLNDKYVLSIPLFLLLIENILRNKHFRIKSKLSGKFNDIAQVVLKSKTIDGYDIFDLNETVKNYLTEILFKSTWRTSNDFFNRNNISHGFYLDYGSKKNSLQCILIIEFIIKIIT